MACRTQSGSGRRGARSTWGYGSRGILVAALLLAMLTACSGRREIRIAGRTMGTTYHVTIIGGYLTSVAQLKRAIDARLEEINASMSTYRPESEISRFNAMQKIDTAFPVGSHRDPAAQVGYHQVHVFVFPSKGLRMVPGH